MSSWSCRHEHDGLCRKVDDAYCRPGMKGCVLVGKVAFQDGVVPAPVWPEEKPATASATTRSEPPPPSRRE